MRLLGCLFYVVVILGVALALGLATVLVHAPTRAIVEAFLR